MPEDWRKDVLKLWFSLDPKQWWSRDDGLDRRIRERFARLWEEQRERPLSAFLADPLTALAAVILFDQFPRNMFRGHADQFATDHVALAVAKGAIDREFDDSLEPRERSFLYMPFQHSESLADQEQSLLLFTRLGDSNMLGYAKKHRDIIAQFGRFPHRNAMLGRAPRAAEIAAGDVNPF
ncbi:MAG TPA: DUF924 family protein [Sphingomicrobium sp.]|nr:DUF924 family protein [Sphingomicrobium sp.]